MEEKAAPSEEGSLHEPDPDPGPHSGRWRRPIVALLAAAVPVIVLVATVVGNGDDPEREAGRADPSGEATTADSSGDDSTSTTDPASDTGDGDPTEAASTPVTEPEIPSRPIDAGPEGDRTVATYPQPTVPSGGCQAVDGQAVVDLGHSPSPACVRVGAEQALVFRNSTGEEISVVAEGLNEIIAPGGELTVGRAADAFPAGQSAFWSPGNPALSGLVEVV